MSDAKQKFESMVQALSGDLYRYAVYLCRNSVLAEDLVQETFLRAWKHLDSLRDEGKARSWLITTLRREHARLYERYRPPFDDIDLDSVAAGADSVDAGVDVMALRQTVFDLPPKYRDVLALQIIGGFNGAEIAQLVGLPLATVNTRLFRARQQLRKRFEASREGDQSGRNRA